MKSLLFAKNTSLVLTRMVAGAVSALLIASFLARTLGPEGNGIYALVILCPVLAVAIGELGVGPASVYLISRGRFGIPEIVAKNIIVSLLTASIVSLVGLFIVLLYGHKWFHNVPLSLLVIGLLMIFPLMMFGNLVAIFHGTQNFKLHGFYTVLPRVINAVLLVLFLGFFKGKLTVAVLSWGLGYVFALGAIIYRFRDEVKSFKRSFGLHSQYLSESLKYGLKSHISNLVTILNYRIDVYILGALAGTYAVGIYAVTVPVTEAIWLVSNAASAVLFPLVASQHKDATSKNDTPVISRWVLLVTALAAFLVVVAKDIIIGLFFGRAFAESGTVLLWLLPGVVLWAVARVLCNDIAGRGRPDINLYISLIALVINIIANLVLIPKFGVNGAAIASSISYGLFTIMVVFVYSRLLHVKIRNLILPSWEDLLIAKNTWGRIVNRMGQL